MRLLLPIAALSLALVASACEATPPAATDDTTRTAALTEKLPLAPVGEPAISSKTLAQMATVAELGPWAEITLFGPLSAGTTVSRSHGDPLVVPAKGSYYAVLADPHPEAAWQHPASVGLVRAEDGAFKLYPTHQRPILRSGKQTLAFSESEVALLEEVQLRLRTATPALDQLQLEDEEYAYVFDPNNPDDPVPDPHPGTGDKDDECTSLALVFDAGDKSSRDLSDRFYLNANGMADYYETTHDEVLRYSNHTADGNTHPRATGPEMVDIIAENAKDLALLPCESCCHQLDVYLTGHGLEFEGTPVERQAWTMLVYHPDDDASSNLGSFELNLLVNERLREADHPGCVRIRFVIDSCHAGGFIVPANTHNDGVDYFGGIPLICEVACGLSVYMATDVANTTMVNPGHSVTHHFLTLSKGSFEQRWAAAAAHVNGMDKDAETQKHKVFMSYGSVLDKTFCGP